MKPIALIAIASGSSDVDVIVTSSVLSKLGVEVVIASTDGWSAVTLRNGLVIKPTCSLERALISTNRRPFDFLILPDGDDVSVGRLECHPELSSVVKTITRKEKRDENATKYDERTDASKYTWIVAAGQAVRMIHTLGVLDECSSNGIDSILNMVKTWMIKGSKGAKIVHQTPAGRNGVGIILCSSAPEDDPLRTVKVCTAIARKCAMQCLKKEELEKYGNCTFSMLETYRKIEESYNVAEYITEFLVNLRDNPRVPSIIRKLCLAPVCAAVTSERPSAYHLGKLHPGNSFINEITNKYTGDEVHPSVNTLQLLTQSSSYVVGVVWKFVQESLKLRKRPLTMCRAAVLVANRVNEQVLSVLVHELRHKFKISTHVVACDRGVLRTTDPFIITRGMLKIRSDVAIEKVLPCYDVILVIDSEVDLRGPGMWYRKSTFNWDDFETIKKTGIPPYSSCVTATFDSNKDGGKATLDSVTRQTRKKLNPLTNQYITWETSVAQDPKPIPESKFFEVCDKRGQKKDGFAKERDCHDLVFQTFLPFHNRADMHTTISSQTSAQDALDFARAVTDCLRHLMARRGHGTKSITNESQCCIL